MTTHVLEKGIAHASRRPFFGQAAVKSLMASCGRYVRLYGCADRDIIDPARSVLREYVKIHSTCDGCSTNGIVAEIEDFLAAAEQGEADHPGHVAVGTRVGAGASAHGCGPERAFRELVLSRHSVRDFGVGKVGLEVITACIALAQRSPSSCNRQSPRVYVVQNQEAMQCVLNVQNGARGSLRNIAYLILFAGDLGCYQNSAERNLVYVDGSLFAMTLMLALHASGLATCCMHLALTPSQEKVVRRTAGVDPSHALVMAIAVGSYSDCTNVTPSNRLNLSRIVRYR